MTAPAKPSPCWKGLLFYPSIVCAVLAVLCGVLLQSLPQPADVHGQHVLGFGALLEFYVGLFLHVMNFGHQSIPPAPRISDDQLAALPSQWDLAALPELHAGINFTNQQELLEAFAPFRDSKPVVIKKFFSHENASRWASSFQKLARPWWDTDYLRQALAGVEVRVFENHSTDDSLAWWKFEDYADEVITNESSIAYARAITEFWEVREHMFDAFDFELVDEMSGRTSLWRRLLHGFHMAVGPIALFVSGRIPKTRLHADMGESFVFHTEGHKRWRFFPPEMSPLLRPVTMVRTVGFLAGSDIWKPDFEAEPHLRLLRGWEVVTDPGDLIFFPSQTWHGVENIGDRNVVFDIARLDVPRGLRQNWPLALATMLHPGGAINMFKFCVLGAESRDGHRLPEKYSCGKEVFFQTYGTKNAQKKA